MKTFFALILLLVSFQIYALNDSTAQSTPKSISTDEDLQLQVVIAPLMNLSQKIPIEMSYENRKNHLLNPEVAKKEALHSATIVKSKTFSWVPILTFVIVGFVIAIILVLPHQHPLNKMNSNKQPPLFMARKELRILDQSTLLQEGQFKQYFIKLDRVVRLYIEGTYHYNISNYASSEFIKKTASDVSMDDNIRLKLKNFLEKSDLVKFGNYNPTPQECSTAFETVKELTKKKHQ